jgi:Uma2 family endonuclease
MAVSRDKLYTVKEFQEHVSRPENADRLFELINGEIVEVSPGRTNNSALEHILSYAVRSYCEKNGIPCYISGGDGAFAVNGHVVAPDFAYKTTPMSDEYPDPVAPEWAIEIISPTDKASDIRDKRNIYIEAEILYGELYPESQSVDVYAPGQPKQTVDINGILDAGDVIPGFNIALKEIFSRL